MRHSGRVVVRRVRPCRRASILAARALSIDAKSSLRSTGFQSREFHKNISERTECDAQSLIGMAFATQLLGYAMREVLTAHDIDLYRINYQDNGNWAFLRGDSHPLMHIHLYGRVKNETRQSYGQALVFPDPGDEYYRGLVPVPDEILYEIFECMRHALSERIFDMPFESDDIVFALDGTD